MPQITNSAPVMAFDYPPDARPIWPCTDCYPWHVEVVVLSEDSVSDSLNDSRVLVREWHAIGCRFWLDVDGSEGEPA